MPKAKRKLKKPKRERPPLGTKAWLLVALITFSTVFSLRLAVFSMWAVLIGAALIGAIQGTRTIWKGWIQEWRREDEFYKAVAALKDDEDDVAAQATVDAYREQGSNVIEMKRRKG